MLVLSRKRGERVVITTPEGVTIYVTLVETQGGGNGKCRIGFDAPSKVSIHREEVYEEIRKSDKGQAGTNGGSS